MSNSVPVLWQPNHACVVAPFPQHSALHAAASTSCEQVFGALRRCPHVPSMHLYSHAATHTILLKLIGHMVVL